VPWASPLHGCTRRPAAAFHDIILGANPAPATPGWDYTTGRGTPDITALIAGV